MEQKHICAVCGVAQETKRSVCGYPTQSIICCPDHDGIFIVVKKENADKTYNQVEWRPNTRGLF